MVAQADKAGLNSAIEAVESLNEGDYTPDSWAALEEALEAAQAVAADPDATEGEISEVLSNLGSAHDNLVRKADKTDLNNAITEVGSLNESDYTPETWSALETAL